jgi:DeoR/GlpR family transcriptional regulator of sugar metabolism
MLIISRQQQILDILKRERSVTVPRLARELFASEPTIRRDLAVLERQGYLKRVYGGAILGGAPDREIPYDVRASEQEDAKTVMARRAASYLHKGDVVFLDGSSSAAHMVDPIAEVGDILVVTSGAKTAIALAERGVRVISTGGQMITRSYSYVGSLAEACVRGIRADSVFFSCRGLSDAGEMTDISIEEINLRRIMLERARVKILLCDSSKLGKQYLYSLGYREDLDAVISELDPKI